MADRSCILDGCEGVTGVPGTAREMCSRHYQKWQKYGDPLAERQLKPTVCAIEGCGLKRFSRDWCSKHYTNWRRFGDPLHRLRGEVRDGKRICAECQRDLPEQEFRLRKHASSGRSPYCCQCVRERQAARRVIKPDPLVPRVETSCGLCGQTFLGNGRNRSYCSSFCAAEWKRLDDLTRPVDIEQHRAASERWRKANPDKSWAKSKAYSARKQTATVEKVDRVVVFERDNWMCHICGDAIDRSVVWPDLFSATIDHVEALSIGGAHSYDNCRAAHLLCNIRKGAKELSYLGR